MDPVAALALVTLDPAKQLGIGGASARSRSVRTPISRSSPVIRFPRCRAWSSRSSTARSSSSAATLFEARQPTGVVAPLEATRTRSMACERTRPRLLSLAAPCAVTGPDVENGTLVIRDGASVALGRDVEIPPDAQRIDVSGMHLWPGMISLARRSRPARGRRRALDDRHDRDRGQSTGPARERLAERRVRASR